jgi:hypothetical protein
VAISLNILRRDDNKIYRPAYPDQASVDTSCEFPTMSILFDDEQIQITIRSNSTKRRRTEQDDSIWRSHGHNALNNLLQVFL